MAINGNKNGLIAALDVGSNKVCCFIAGTNADASIAVEGIGHQLSKGIKGGAVVDIESVESSIRAAVDAAERMAGETINQVYLNISNGTPRSEVIRVEVRISGHQVTEDDVVHALDEARRKIELTDRVIVHTVPIGYAIDGTRGIRDPRGMYADHLSVDIHIVTTSAGPLRNLYHCLDRCHLGIAGTVLSPFASGLSCLVPDEQQIGVTVIDMGGGTTSVSVFLEGNMVYGDIIAIGGQHVTNDIARGLLISVNDAERMKTLFGSAVRSPSDDRETITITQVGEDSSDQSQTILRSMLTGIIQPRVEEIFETVHEHLISSGFDRVAGKRIVLTGGASQLQGVREISARILDKRVRLGRPTHIEGLAESTAGPAFATCAGLLAYAVQGDARTGNLNAAMLADSQPKSAMARVGQWLRDNF